MLSHFKRFPVLTCNLLFFSSVNFSPLCLLCNCEGGESRFSSLEQVGNGCLIFLFFLVFPSSLFPLAFNDRQMKEGRKGRKVGIKTTRKGCGRLSWKEVKRVREGRRTKGWKERGGKKEAMTRMMKRVKGGERRG